MYLLYIAIALSDQAIVVATSKNYLRFFTIFGLQNYIFSFPSIVCMAAYSNLLLIAYHLSVAYKGRYWFLLKIYMVICIINLICNICNNRFAKSWICFV